MEYDPSNVEFKINGVVVDDGKSRSDRDKFIDKAYDIMGLSTPSVAYEQLGKLYDNNCRFVEK